MSIKENIIRHLGVYKFKYFFSEKTYLCDSMDVKKCWQELEEYNPDVKASCVRTYAMDRTQRKVSVIVPAYNASEYIENCLNSLIRQQTIYDYEIIVVNDGSTDDTLKRIKSKKCENLRIIDKSNGGISSARNTGILNAQGEYLI